MFAFIRGKIAAKELSSVVIDCGGVGFLLSTTYHTLQSLPEVGKEATLYTYLSVREDAMELFGFADKEELSCYKMMITVSGVGAKVALAILSELSPARFALAVSAGDVKALTKAPGVGPKLAQRIILELKDKIAKETVAADVSALETMDAAPSANNAEEAVKALVVLGYSQNEAKAAVAKQDPSLSVEELIRITLRSLM